MIMRMGDIDWGKVAASAPPSPLVVASHRSPAEQAAMRADQQTICQRAQDAKARGSVAYPALAAECLARRVENINRGLFYTDGLSPDDAAYRVALNSAGEAVVMSNPALQAARAALPTAEQQRGFTIAQAVRGGSLDAGFPGFAAAALSRSPDLLKGFTDAMAAPSGGLTQAQRPEEPGLLDKIPRPVLIGGAVAVALGVGLVAFKLTR